MKPARCLIAGCVALALLLGGCDASFPNRQAVVSLVPYPAVTQPQAAAFENAERLARYQGLAGSDTVAPPSVEQLYASAGTDPTMAEPVPVVQVVFTEKVFFDTATDVPRPESAAALDMIARNILQDVPRAQVTVLGHTDAIGGDEYNMALSERRAASVLHALVDRGVDPGQLSAVAIGKRQPVATNATPEGRALNRRVEFLISGSQAANLAVIGQRPTDPGFLAPAEGGSPDESASAPVQVFRPRTTAAGIVMAPSQTLGLNYLPNRPAPTARSAPLSGGVTPVHAQPPPISRTPDQAPHYEPNTPENYHKQDLGAPQTF